MVRDPGPLDVTYCNPGTLDVVRHAPNLSRFRPLHRIDTDFRSHRKTRRSCADYGQIHITFRDLQVPGSIGKNRIMDTGIIAGAVTNQKSQSILGVTAELPKSK